MSKKHEKRTRTEILEKRMELDVAVERRRIQVQPVESRSKYSPHFGAKQEAKLRCQREARELKLAA